MSRRQGYLFAELHENERPPPVITVGDLDKWLDTKTSEFLFAYATAGESMFERLSCLRAIIRREYKHQRDHHSGGPTGAGAHDR